MGIANIIWIEADPGLTRWLVEHCREPVFNYAMCDQDHTKRDFHLANNDGESSSLLWPKEHIQEYPVIGFDEIIQVPAITLDTLIAEQNIVIDEYNFVNMDIQGAELLALNGMTKTLLHIEGVYTEVNFIEMYEGCGLVGEVDTYLADYGFQRRITYNTGRGWGDALYVRHNY